MQDATRVEQPKPEWAGFDERARNTMYAARDEALVQKHGHVGTEHVLVGLLRDPDCVARRALGDLGVDVSTLEERARTMVPPGDTLIAADPALSPRAKKALTLAVDEDRRLKAKNIGTEHLLVGLLAAGDGMAYAALTEAGVTLAAVRAAIQRHRATG
jgi:ATP-dependent Clp protease ATP-binding subunit ClpC